MVGRDRRARRTRGPLARNSRMTGRFGNDRKMKFSSSRFAAMRGEKTNSAKPRLLARSSTQSSFEIEMVFGTRTWLL
jgi:hypothetical protein